MNTNLSKFDLIASMMKRLDVSPSALTMNWLQEQVLSFACLARSSHQDEPEQRLVGTFVSFLYFFLLPTYNIADIIEETANIPKANLNANKYVMASYPPLPSGILNMNEIEMKYDNIVSKIGITI